ncbi:MAG: hypothetical protein NTZ05_16760 [Chloroflexi bacterium]|nr:hypothetical protein [Chloroflexota bacterium]
MYREVVLEAIEDQARWRAEKAREYPNDERNAQAAEGLRDLAAYVQALPEDGERLRLLHKYWTIDDEGGTSDMGMAGEEASRLLSRFRFNHSHEDCDDLLEELVEASRRDLYAMEEASDIPFPKLAGLE